MNLYENYLADTILSMSEYEAITDRLDVSPNFWSWVFLRLCGANTAGINIAELF